MDVGDRHAADVRKLCGDAELIGLVGVRDRDPVRPEAAKPSTSRLAAWTLNVAGTAM